MDKIIKSMNEFMKKMNEINKKYKIFNYSKLESLMKVTKNSITQIKTTGIAKFKEILQS
jgi:hypothetical protein